jgi:hypothetical protein
MSKIFPRTTVGGVSLPRMLIGTNWLLGYSHRSSAADAGIKDRYQKKKISIRYSKPISNTA